MPPIYVPFGTTDEQNERQCPVVTASLLVTNTKNTRPAMRSVVVSAGPLVPLNGMISGPQASQAVSKTGSGEKALPSFLWARSLVSQKHLRVGWSGRRFWVPLTKQGQVSQRSYLDFFFFKQQTFITTQVLTVRKESSSHVAGSFCFTVLYEVDTIFEPANSCLLSCASVSSSPQSKLRPQACPSVW